MATPLPVICCPLPFCTRSARLACCSATLLKKECNGLVISCTRANTFSWPGVLRFRRLAGGSGSVGREWRDCVRLVFLDNGLLNCCPVLISRSGSGVRSGLGGTPKISYLDHVAACLHQRGWVITLIKGLNTILMIIRIYSYTLILISMHIWRLIKLPMQRYLADDRHIIFL